MRKAQSTSQPLHWDIHPSVVLQLGEDLITDVVQALVELVKNSYDADATYAKIVIGTAGRNDMAKSLYPEATGYITIDDDGFGMDLQTIQRGWLTISNSLKREMKLSRQTTGRGRTPLGDKGLGRLGAQRLGSNLEIITRPDGSTTGHHVGFSWRDFQRQDMLSEVPIAVSEIPDMSKKGTCVVVSDLRDIELWKGDAVARLQNELSLMISPYEDVRDFRVVVLADGRSLELAEISERVRDSAQLRYWIDYQDREFSVLGKARLAYLRPSEREENERFRRLIEADGGMGFLQFLTQKPLARDLTIAGSGDDGWFVQFQSNCALADFDSVSLADGALADPGPFKGEVDSFDLGESAKTQDVFGRASEYRDYIKSLSGIRVYRDGFAIRVDKDWLKLGESWTSGTSYYGLKPNNTIGYIALSARDNSSLEETTDREGFKATPYYENFFLLLQHFVRVTLKAQELMRRAALEYVREAGRVEAGVTEVIAPEEIVREINQGLSKAKRLEAPLETLSVTLTQAVEGAQGELTAAQAALTDNQGATDAIQSAARVLTERINEARSVISEIRQYFHETEHLEKLSGVLCDQIDQLREQLDQVYETISLGLTAEVLSHEIHNTADRLALLTRQVTQHLRTSNLRDSKVLTFIEHVNSSIASMRKQLSHLAPSLRYVREDRQAIDVPAFLEEIADYYKERMEHRHIRTVIECRNGADFRLHMNKGKLTQIIDNLFLNSEYWLREDMRTGRIEQGDITVEVDKPYLRISDNGRGVDPSVEESLFEPFITTKGPGKGRGLGLFIVRQLLDSEGCTVSLLPARNGEGRRFIFEIDLSGGLDGSK